MSLPAMDPSYQRRRPARALTLTLHTRALGATATMMARFTCSETNSARSRALVVADENTNCGVVSPVEQRASRSRGADPLVSEELRRWAAFQVGRRRLPGEDVGVSSVIGWR